MSQRTTRAKLATLAVSAFTAIALAGCGSGSGFEDTSTSESDEGLTSSDEGLTILIGSSGEAETTAVEEAVAAWSAESGIDAEVQAASDLNQQLAQGFASSAPPDLFYLTPDVIAGFAGNGSLRPYGEYLSNSDDFYPALVENFTIDDEFYCAPKDFSTLALVINTDLWEAAGLTDADIPTTWDELTEVSTKLTTGEVTGLTFGPEYQRIGVFMSQAGGGLLDGDTVIADSPENTEALTYVQEQLNNGNFAYSSDLGAGWGGEAFGKGMAAMVIEGNWIGGALRNDFPDVNYKVAELPAGPAGPATLQYTNCWGMAADSGNQEAALELVEYLTSAEQQLAFSEAFGPMPSVQSAAEDWTAANPNDAAFLTQAENADFPPTQAGSADVVADFNSQIESLKTADISSILQSTQSNLEAVVG